MRRHDTKPILAQTATRRTPSGFFPLGLQATDSRTDTGLRHIRLETSRVVVLRSVAGIKMRVAVPIALYEGVAIHVDATNRPRKAAIILKHRDPSLDVQLYESETDKDMAAEWQAWARHLGLPMLIVDQDGEILQPFPKLGALAIEPVCPRRKPAHLIKRRPRFLLRRRIGHQSRDAIRYREREIIAPD